MQLKIELFFVCTVLIFLGGTSFAAMAPQTIMKGQSQTIMLDYEVGDVAVADRSVCDYLVGQDRRSLYLSGQGSGETTVTVWDAEGAKKDEFAVRVVTTTLAEVLDTTRSAFGSLKGVRIDVQDGKVEISGQVAEPEDFRQIETMSRNNPRVKSRVRLTRDVMDNVVEAITMAMDAPGVTAKAVRDRVVLEGTAYSQADAKRAVEIAKLYEPDVLDLIEVKEGGRSSVGRGRMIELTFHMMEIKRSALRTLGLNWAPGSMPANGTANAGNGSGAGFFSSIGDMAQSLLGFVFQLIPKLRWIRESGNGRMLENPSMMVKSGENAKIFSGSEIPYYRGDKVEFKKVGIEIEASPIETSNGIDVKLTATLSSPSADIRGAVDTNTVSTTALCAEGASMVLGNIVRNGDVKMKNRIPEGVDASSALFTLFLSKDFQSNRSTFVIFVTPRVVDSPRTAELELKNYLATEEAMILARSKKEYRELMASRAVEDVGREIPERKSRRKKWR